MGSEVERTLRTIFRRCVQCPDTTPSCPTCKDTEICSLVPTTCDACAYATCIANPLPPPRNRGPNVGAIAGGVIGGIAAVALIVFLLWRFWIKPRRAEQDREIQLDAEEWEEDDIAQQKASSIGGMGGLTYMNPRFREDAASTRTRGSLANSILSRASNIIQIAYIPGVTNRLGGGSGTNSLLASNGPVPPVPAARGSQPPKSPLSNEGDRLFFRPGSTFSTASSLDSAGNRDTQYTRHSITPSLARSSMASDAFRESTVEIGPMPATSVARAAPRMVSIKSTSSGGSADSPGTETQDFASPGGKGKGVQVMMPGEGPGLSSHPSVRGKAKQVTVGGPARGRFPVRQPSGSSTLTAGSGKSGHAPVVSSPLAALEDTETEDDAEDEHARARRSLIADSVHRAASPPKDSAPLIQPLESPFFDATEHPSAASAVGRAGPNPYASMGKTIGGGARAAKGNPLSDIIEEGMKRASRATSHEGLGGIRDESPFSDEHEAK